MPHRSPVSAASSYQEIGAYWDIQDATETGGQDPVEFATHIRSQRHYFPVEKGLCQKIQRLADQRGVSGETLLNMVLQEHLTQLEQQARNEAFSPDNSK